MDGRFCFFGFFCVCEVRFITEGEERGKGGLGLLGRGALDGFLPFSFLEGEG